MKHLHAVFVFCISLAAVHAQRTALPPSCGNRQAVMQVATHGHGALPAPPEAGEAKAVFIERADKNALPVVTRVGLDGTWLGANKGDSYFETTISPGEHHVCTDWVLPRRFIKDAPAFDVLTAEAGKTYYFLVGVGWVQNVDLIPVTPDLIEVARGEGYMTLRLSAVNPDEGQYLVLNSKVSTSSVRK